MEYIRARPHACLRRSKTLDGGARSAHQSVSPRTTDRHARRQHPESPRSTQNLGPVLRRLAEATQETVNLGVRFGNEVVNVGQIPGSNDLRSYDWIGESSPLPGALARALLAHLERSEMEVYLVSANAEGAALNPDEYWCEIEHIRLRGFAVNRGEANRRSCRRIPNL